MEANSEKETPMDDTEKEIRANQTKTEGDFYIGQKKYVLALQAYNTSLELGQVRISNTRSA